MTKSQLILVTLHSIALVGYCFNQATIRERILLDERLHILNEELSNKTVPKGYWKISKESKKDLKCPLGSTSCLGGIGDDSCANNYYGPLCNLCQHDFVLEKFQFSCVDCSLHKLISSVILVLPLILIVPLILYCYLGRNQLDPHALTISFLSSTANRESLYDVDVTDTHSSDRSLQDNDACSTSRKSTNQLIIGDVHNDMKHPSVILYEAEMAEERLDSFIYFHLTTFKIVLNYLQVIAMRYTHAFNRIISFKS
jgi:hypothetical protein